MERRPRRKPNATAVSAGKTSSGHDAGFEVGDARQPLLGPGTMVTARTSPLEINTMNRRTNPDRRTVLKTIGGGLLLGSFGALPAGAQPNVLSQQLAAVRAVTSKYKDIETAREDGYGAVSPYVPGMGFHFADGSPFGTDLEDPGVLVYVTNGRYNPDPGAEHDPEHDDDLILGATEWVVPGDREDTSPDIFNDEDSPRNLNVTEAAGWHFEEDEGFTGLHAWVHRDNPAGVFHHTNPTID